jgi:aerobic-type carbon monoxide dehydrogenase small subunit (CoxS/CutS family)
MQKIPIAIDLNGKKVRLEVLPQHTLLQALRHVLNAMEVKNGCEVGDCGACVVFMDGLLVNACLVPAAQADGCQIVTVKGIGTRSQLHPIQDAFIAHGAVQCGFCTPGMVLAAKALLDENPRPDPEEIRRAVAGNYCRCTGYHKIIEAIQAASLVLLKQRSENRLSAGNNPQER